MRQLLRERRLRCRLIGNRSKTANVTILNENVPVAQADALSKTVGQIAAYYRGYMAKPVADQPTFLRMVTIDQVDRDRRQGEWGFATWPTIAMSGSVGNVGKALLEGGDKAQTRVQYIAHEMGHYYFGTLTSPRGPYFWFLLESTAEYLSIKALREISGEAAADRYVGRLASNVEKEKEPFTALDRIEKSSSIGQTYRYSYGPLLLIGLEKQVGEPRMRAFIRGLLSARNVQTWSDLRNIATDAGIFDDLWERWRTTCVEGGRRTCA